MRTAIKVINDRIRILEKYLDDTKDDDSPNSRQNRAKASHAKEMFNNLQSALNKYIDLLRTGVNDPDLAEKISELLSSTMVPLVERNKEIISSYKQMMFSLYEKQEEIRRKGDLTDADRKHLNDLATAHIDYKNAKHDVNQYLEEYEAAEEEIKELIIEGDIRHIFPESGEEPTQATETAPPPGEAGGVVVATEQPAENTHSEHSDEDAERLADAQLRQIMGGGGSDSGSKDDEDDDDFPFPV